LLRSHVELYACPNNVSWLWNIGFLLLISIFAQICSGMLLGLQYTSDINHSYSSILSLMVDVYYGWYLRYCHSSGASIVFGLCLIHIARGLYINSYIFSTSVWLLGVILYLLLCCIAFLGYVLAWGQMSFWGGTVITNLIACVP
jgi:quinol-cytochrome oxidoreductase complex cytochrome b subunit